MKCLNVLATALAAAAALALPTTASAGFVWTEKSPGAGDLLATAQATYDSAFNSMSGISGALGNNSGAYEVDLYRIRIDDPLNFSAAVIDGVNDFGLFLFDAAGAGVFMSDDNPFPDPWITGAPVAAGLYYLAVALMVSTPVDGLGNSIFDCLGCATSGPVAGTGALDGWSLNSSFAGSPFNYQVQLVGATNSDIPEPATAALLLAGGIGAWLSSRRRKNTPLTPVAA